MFAGILRSLRAQLQRRRVAREMDDELRFHVDMEVQSNLKLGMPFAEARRVALRDLGGVDQTKEAIRDVRATWVDSVWQDVKQASRSLCARPSVSLAAIAMLGLAIAITTAMFTLVDALILRPVPFRAPEELARVSMGNERGSRYAVAPAVLQAWRDSQVFAGVEAAVSETGVIELGGVVVARRFARVTPGLFGLLGGVRPVRGRLFDTSDGGAGSDDRALVSEDLWRSLYDADPAIVGRRITIDGDALVVVGVLPSEFRFPTWDTVIWRASTFDTRSAVLEARPIAYVRFAAGMPHADALRLAMDPARAADKDNAQLWPQASPLAGLVLDKYYQRAVPLLAGGVVLVFLVLSANVSSLLLARLTARRREFSMRSALGASRGRLVRQSLVESFAAIAIAAAAGGLFSVLSYAVGRRKREFGIRTALGASPAQIRRAVLGDGLLVATTGIAIGALGAWSVARALASLQYGVTMSDPVSWVLVLGLLGCTTTAASWRPAREAARVDPVLLLREE